MKWCLCQNTLLTDRYIPLSWCPEKQVLEQQYWENAFHDGLEIGIIRFHLNLILCWIGETSSYPLANRICGYHLPCSSCWEQHHCEQECRQPLLVHSELHSARLWNCPRIHKQQPTQWSLQEKQNEKSQYFGRFQILGGNWSFFATNFWYSLQFSIAFCKARGISSQSVTRQQFNMKHHQPQQRLLDALHIIQTTNE